MQYDMHTHSLCSHDGREPLSVMAQTALRVGLDGMFVTDHCDILIGRHGVPAKEGDFTWQESETQYRAAKKQFAGKLDIRLGLELGNAPDNIPLARSILAAGSPDFVLGSVHNCSLKAGGDDFFYADFQDLDACKFCLDDYFESLSILAPLDVYDSLAHINYPFRYIQRVHPEITVWNYEAQVREIFKRVAQTGHALEVNTNRGAHIEVWRDIIACFLDCGGELITIGSDAHMTEGVGAGIVQAQQLLLQCGVRHFALYHDRKPEMIPISL